MWTRDSLRDFVRRTLKDVRLICVSNREPYLHESGDGGVRVLEPACGVVTALDPVMQATDGIWIGHGSGSADRDFADARGRRRVPPGRGRYTLKRVWLSPEEEEGYYYGFANSALWPLCHNAYERPVFEESHWRAYRSVNERFAEAVAEEAGDERSLVFIQDYHFALLSALLKRWRRETVVAHFWHVPWPSPEAFRICPWKEEILEGLLGNDLLGFHIQYHCNNFLEAIDREIESRIDRERFSVNFRGSTTLVRPHPISVDFEGISRISASEAAARRRPGRRGSARPAGLADRGPPGPDQFLPPRALRRAVRVPLGAPHPPPHGGRGARPGRAPPGAPDGDARSPLLSLLRRRLPEGTPDRQPRRLDRGGPPRRAPRARVLPDQSVPPARDGDGRASRPLPRDLASGHDRHDRAARPATPRDLVPAGQLDPGRRRRGGDPSPARAALRRRGAAAALGGPERQSRILRGHEGVPQRAPGEGPRPDRRHEVDLPGVRPRERGAPGPRRRRGRDPRPAARAPGGAPDAGPALDLAVPHRPLPLRDYLVTLNLLRDRGS